MRKYNSVTSGWDVKNSGMGTDINVTALDFNRQNSGILYAGTINPSGSSHVYKSTDYGETWAISAGHDGRAVTDIKVNPISTLSAHVYVATNNGLWRSTDSGSNWSSIASTSLGFSDVDFSSIAINPINGDLWALTKTQVWYSYTDGSFWTDVVGPDAVAGRALFAYGNQVNNVDVYLMNGKPNSILLSKILDQQFLWQTLTKQLNGSANISARDYIIHPTVGGISFAAGRGNNAAQIFKKTGASGNLFYSVYSGSSNASGNFNAVRIDPSNVHYLLAVAEHDANLSEIAYSTSDGNSNTWNPPPGPPTKGDYFDLAYDKNSGSPSPIAYAVGGDNWSSGSLLPALLFSKSVDGGLHWTTTSPVITSDRRRYRSIAIDPINTAVLYCGYDAVLSSVSGGIHKSTNGGQTWTTLTMPLTGSMHHIVSLLHHPTKSNVLYLAGEADPGVWRISATYDGGSKWNPFRTGIESYIPILRLALKSNLVSLECPQSIFYSADEDVYHDAGVYRSDMNDIVDGGSTIATKWNMLSLPAFVCDQSKSTVFPNATTSAYFRATASTYVAQSNINWGKGYWVKYGTTQALSYTGSPISALDVPVFAGWNMIGSLSQPLATTQITPASIITSKFYGFDGSVYSSSSALEPGKAYWVRCSAAGTITLDVNSTANNPPSASNDLPPDPPPPPLPAAPVLSCSNCTVGGQHPSFSWTATAPGGTYQVYRGQCGNLDYDCYSDPFWRGIYDGPGTSLVDGGVTVFQKTGANTVPTSVYFYAVTATDQFSQVSPKSNIQSVNSGSGWITKTASRETPEEPAQEQKPDVYRLYPNYPNPFNPTTSIYYTLPEDQYVQLVVVNVLGQEVARLVDGFEGAGYKKVEFQAGSLPSGVYYYHLKAGTFDDVKKMLIAK